MDSKQSIAFWRTVMGGEAVPVPNTENKLWVPRVGVVLVLAMHGEPNVAQGAELMVYHVHPSSWYIVHPDGTNMGRARGTAEDRVKRLQQMLRRHKNTCES